MPKIFTSKTQKVGEFGESLACRFLISKGFSILERNYTKKWGEIDIIAKNGEKIHFFEVKTVSYETNNGNFDNVTHETTQNPEQNVHPVKLKKIFRTIETYLMNQEDETDWQLDVLAVFLDLKSKKAKIRITEDIVG